MGAQWKAKGKELAANARGKLFGRLAKDIMVAARGGADPASNARLRLVVEQARKVSMPKETLDRAIRKGAGLTYTPQKAGSLEAGTWQPLTATPTVVDVNGEWERVIVVEPLPAALENRAFARVLVSQ